MNIHVLGTRGYIRPSAPRHSLHSGVLIDEALMLDCGEKQFLAHQPEFILITHLHPDHAFFIGARNRLQSLPASTFAPTALPALNVKELTTTRRLGEYKVMPIPTEHSHLVASQAYLVE